MDTTTKELQQDFQQKKKEVAQLRSQLNILYGQKEEVFRQIQALRKEHLAKVQRIKLLKSERDTFTEQVKLLKEQRNKLNQDMKDKAQALKSADKKKAAVEGGIPEHPGQLKAMISRLERKIETEVMPFEQEKKLTKKVKELREQYKKVQQAEQVWRERNTAAADFSSVRKVAQDSHHLVQKTAEESQQRHEEMTKLYDEVRIILDQLKPLERKHLELKKQYASSKNEWEGILLQLNQAARQLEGREHVHRQQTVEEKTAYVQEKIRKRQKLTTEDILAFQAIKE